MATRAAIRIALSRRVSRRVKQLRVDLTYKRRTDFTLGLGANLDRDQVLGPRPQTVADVVAGDDEIGPVLRDTSHPPAAELGAAALATSARPRTWRASRRGSASTRERGDPNRCAIAAYHGSWEQPVTNSFADRVLASAAKDDAPDFERPEGTGNETGEVNPTSRNAAAGDGSIRDAGQ
jgi:hypothetical protein